MANDDIWGLDYADENKIETEREETKIMKTEIEMTPEIYAARPYVARVVTGSFSGSFRFDTYAEAVQYVRQQAVRNGILSPCTANNWSNKGVRPSVLDTHVEGPDGVELSIEEIGVAVQCEGPLANWIVLQEGEVIARRLPKPVTEMTEEQAEIIARSHGWTTIDEGGWDGNLICHRDHLDDRAGREYGSWIECVQNLPKPKDLTVLDRIASHQAQSRHFEIITFYADGTTRTHHTATLAQAKNWATGERRKIGRRLTDRATGRSVEITAVNILTLEH